MTSLWNGRGRLGGSREWERIVAMDSALHSLVLELSPGLSSPRPVREFLRDYAVGRNRDPGDFDYTHYLAAVWPDGSPTTVYASNIGSDPNAPPHLRNLLLRPVCEGPLKMRASVGGLALGVAVYRRQGKLVVRRVEVTPHVERRDFEARISAPLIWSDPDAYMDAGDFEALGGLPFHRAQTRERLDEWRRYLQWKEQLVRANQVIMPYAGWRWEEAESIVSFVVHRDHLPDRRIVGMELDASARPAEPADDEQRSRRRRQPDRIELGEVEEVRGIKGRGRGDWPGVEVTPDHRCVRIRLDEDAAELRRRRPPPAEGQLMSSIAGDIAPLLNQMAGLDRLNNSQGFSPRLADFIFDARNGSRPSVLSELADVPGSRALNAGQQAAVAKALAAPDLCLIQGPPGTGKTTVIAEICLRATREGKRVLVSSQTNLAVDNALGRLSDVPGVRPLRLGDPGKVDDEFRDFLAENVVERWFATIADHCRQRMRRVEQEEAQLEAQEAAIAQMKRALDEERRWSQALDAVAAELQSAEATWQARKHEAHGARQMADELMRRCERLEHLTRWAREGAALPPTSVSEPWPSHLPLPRGLAPARATLAVLDALRARRGALEAVMNVLGRARAGVAVDVDAAAELRALRDEKLSLIDSDRDADLRRLQQVNRRIKALEDGGWNELTGQLHRAARGAWATDRPDCITVIIDALRPSRATDAALDEALARVEHELEGAREATALVERSGKHWAALHDAAGAELATARERGQSADDGARAAHARVERWVERRRAANESREAARADWAAGWQVVWPRSAPDGTSQPALDLATHQVTEARAAQSAHLGRARRWRGIQQEWVERLGRVAESDREQLQALYVRHSNVVGMTCNEAGKRKTWQDSEFKPFDIVIVDEVSKATPPELILPLLLGEKAVLVGDHRQLPPMFRERDASFGEAAAEGAVSEEDFKSFRRMVTASVFQELFEQAPQEIKAMLWTQYRMHPLIMDAVNQFYEGRLEAGPDREALASKRVHHIDVADVDGGRLLAGSHRLLWVDTTKALDGTAAWETQEGSSKVNPLEVDVVVAFLARLGAALAARGYGRDRHIDVPAVSAGATWEAVVREAAPELPLETLADLFDERRVRIDGRAQRRDGRARPNVRLELRAQKEVGVITFYGAQLKELRRAIDAARARSQEAFASMELRTNTVDRFQGMEKPIIVASLVRASRGRLGSFVREFQRINVAFSRAQQLLVVVGAEGTWKHAEVPLPPIDGGEPVDVPAYRNILELARLNGGRRLARQVISR